MTQDQRKKAINNYSSARTELVIIVLLTAANVLVALLGSDLEFLFTATVPYAGALILHQFGMTLLGIAAAAVALLFYLWCWHLSRRSHVWLTVAAVAYALDTVFTVWFIVRFSDPVSVFVPLGVHIAAEALLITGAAGGFRLARHPVTPESAFTAPPQYGSPQWDQTQQYQYQQQYPPQQQYQPQYPPQPGSENGGPDGGAR